MTTALGILSLVIALGTLALVYALNAITHAVLAVEQRLAVQQARQDARRHGL